MNAGMRQVSIQGIQEDPVEQAKRQATERGISLNHVLREALLRGLAIHGELATNGLERFAGTCPEGFGPEFEAAMRDCSQIACCSWS